MERLRNSGRESRKRHKILQSQVRTLIEERADFLVQVQDQNREINGLRKSLGIAEKETDDLLKVHEKDDANRARFSTAELKDLLLERDELKAKIENLEAELGLCKPITSPLDDTKSEEEK